MSHHEPDRERGVERGRRRRLRREDDTPEAEHVETGAAEEEPDPEERVATEADLVADLGYAAGAVLRAGLGRWLRVGESRVGLIQPSPYVKRPQPSGVALFRESRSRYLVVYPFTKSAAWYRLPAETRKAAMAE